MEKIRLIPMGLLPLVKHQVVKLTKFFVKPELSLMESSGKAVLIAKPSIMALNGETAHILIGERIPVIEEAEVNGERKRSTRYEEVGIKLNYTPNYYR